MTDTREAILGEIEALLGRYLTADADTASQVMVTGYVFKVTGRTFEDGEVHRLHGWACPEEQDTHMTLGLAEGLARDAQAWYDQVVVYDGEDDE